MKISRRRRYGCIPKAIHYPIRSPYFEKQNREFLDSLSLPLSPWLLGLGNNPSLLPHDHRATTVFGGRLAPQRSKDVGSPPFFLDSTTPNGEESSDDAAAGWIWHTTGQRAVDDHFGETGAESWASCVPGAHMEAWRPKLLGFLLLSYALGHVFGLRCPSLLTFTLPLSLLSDAATIAPATVQSHLHQQLAPASSKEVS
ncbi:hypothetical protein CXB51_015330 [Gossypium anomalum]|uniref:Uncharacterized protein n=1 Tax=Gossypium anomalum TaxID=47600 RepID=A0A8J5YSM2_9ROSI|nr:hypothetical protein CXB51_015330 [Gossypium anomalum]